MRVLLAISVAGSLMMVFVGLATLQTPGVRGQVPLIFGAVMFAIMSVVAYVARRAGKI